MKHVGNGRRTTPQPGNSHGRQHGVESWDSLAKPFERDCRGVSVDGPKASRIVHDQRVWLPPMLEQSLPSIADIEAELAGEEMLDLPAAASEKPR